MKRSQELLDNAVARMEERRAQMAQELRTAEERIVGLRDALTAVDDEIDDFRRGAAKLKRP